MNERFTATLTTVVFLGVLGGALWSVLSQPGARHAVRPDSDVAISETLVKLSESVAALREQIGGGASAPAAAASGAAPRPALELAPGEIPVHWIDDPLPSDDPYAGVWNRAPAVRITLKPQQETMPMLENPSVEAVEVQALTNGRRIAWRMSWADPQADFYLDTDRFCDAAAIQFPLAANASFKMGDRDFPVYIVQWKAIWQKDVDEGFQDVQDLHPNYWTDLYWFAEGGFPFRVPAAFRRPESLDYFVAYRAGNPLADFRRQQPFQELIAEGFGTLTTQSQQTIIGRGQWKDGRWAVVFCRAMETTDSWDYQFRPGTRDLVAFAVWEGGAGSVSGRKHYSEWAAFQVQQ